MTKLNRIPKQHWTILTSTPLKDLMEEEEEKKKAKLEKTTGRTNKIKGLSQAKRTILNSPEEESRQETKDDERYYPKGI